MKNALFTKEQAGEILQYDNQSDIDTRLSVVISKEHADKLRSWAKAHHVTLKAALATAIDMLPDEGEEDAPC